MNRRRRPTFVDNRPSWRDPNMPVMLNCTDRETGKPYLGVYESDRATQAFAYRMAQGNALPWNVDPTYNLNRKSR